MTTLRTRPTSSHTLIILCQIACMLGPGVAVPGTVMHMVPWARPDMFGRAGPIIVDYSNFSTQKPIFTKTQWNKGNAFSKIVLIICYRLENTWRIVNFKNRCNPSPNKITSHLLFGTQTSPRPPPPHTPIHMHTQSQICKCICCAY